MADVTNQGKQVASTTSGQKLSTTGATDVNLTPAGVPVPANNYAPTGDATGFASKTETSGGKTLREGDPVGPPSKDPHPGTAGGVSSGTYLDKAEDKSGSPNVKVEGKPAARDKDDTTQNKGNAPGQVMEGAGAKELPTVAESTKEACSIVAIKVECEHKRGLGENQGTRQLQIIDGDTLTLHADRINAKRSDAKAACSPGGHTEWRVRRKKGGGLTERNENIPGDDITLNADWFKDESWLEKYIPNFELGSEQDDGDSGAGGKPDDVADKFKSKTAAKNAHRQEFFSRAKALQKGGMSKKDAYAQATKDMNTARKPAPLPSDKNSDAAKRAAGADDAKAKAARGITSAAQLAAHRGMGLAKWRRVYKWADDPGYINIQAVACSGTQSCDIYIFPEDEEKFTFGPEEFNLFKAVFATFENFGKYAERFLNILGGRVRIAIDFLQDPECELTTQWKELTQDAPLVNKKKYQCNNTFEVSLAFRKLVGIEVNFGVPLATALGGIGLGRLAQKLIDYIADVTLGVRFKIDMGLRVEWKTDEYKNPTKRKLTMPFAFELFFFASARVGRWLSVTVEVGAKWDPVLENLQQFLPEGDIGFELREGTEKNGGAIRPGLRAVFRVNALWWERDEYINIFPKSWALEYSKKTIRPFQSFFARNDG